VAVRPKLQVLTLKTVSNRAEAQARAVHFLSLFRPNPVPRVSRTSPGTASDPLLHRITAAKPSFEPNQPRIQLYWQVRPNGAIG
jgi:hypothetical protein